MDTEIDAYLPDGSDHDFAHEHISAHVESPEGLHIAPNNPENVSGEIHYTHASGHTDHHEIGETGHEDLQSPLGIEHEWHTPLSEWSWGTSEQQNHKFDAHHSDAATIHGNPTSDMAYWHQQTYPDTCAVVSQEFILESMGIHLTEDQLRTEAFEHGFYTPGAGTPPYAMGDLLELHGIHVEKVQGASLDDIQFALDQHEKVLVAVHADDIWHPTAALPSDPFGFSGHSADHAVEVIGIDRTDPNHPMVVLNDSGAPNGQGSLIPYEQFMHAWHDSNNYMVYTNSTISQSAVSNTPIWNYTASLAGYYNADGTYHYTSDNTDRDAETGAIIRRY